VRILASAGEASGRALLGLLKAELAQLDATGNVIPLHDQVGLEPVFGFVEGLRAGPKLRAALGRAEELAMKAAPDLAVLVSFSGLHLPLGRRLRRQGIPVLYLGPPQVWAWGGWRLRQLREAADQVVCLFRFEQELLRRTGIDARYFGYPLLDGVASEMSRRQVLSRLGLGPDERYLVFLPGSRPAEVAYHAPLFDEVLIRLQPSVGRLSGVMVLVDSGPASSTTTAAQSASDEQVKMQDANLRGQNAPSRGTDENPRPSGQRRESASRTGVLSHPEPRCCMVVAQDRYDVMRQADCACAVSGTVTAELAILGVPMVVSYHLGWLSRAMARVLVRTPHFSLPNILAQRPLVPERLNPKPEWLVQTLQGLLSDPTRRQQQLAGLARVAAELGPPGAMRQVARLALDLGDASAVKPQRKRHGGNLFGGCCGRCL